MEILEAINDWLLELGCQKPEQSWIIPGEFQPVGVSFRYKLEDTHCRITTDYPVYCRIGGIDIAHPQSLQTLQKLVDYLATDPDILRSKSHHNLLVKDGCLYDLGYFDDQY